MRPQFIPGPYKMSAALLCILLRLCSAPTSLSAQAGETPGPRGELRKGIFETPRGVLELEYELTPDGRAVFEGDILLPLDLLRLEQSGGKGRHEAAVVSAFGLRWPYGIVPVEDSAMARDARVTWAMQR